METRHPINNTMCHIASSALGVSASAIQASAQMQANLAQNALINQQFRHPLGEYDGLRNQAKVQVGPPIIEAEIVPEGPSRERWGVAKRLSPPKWVWIALELSAGVLALAIWFLSKVGVL